MPNTSPLFDFFSGAKKPAPTALGSLPAPPPTTSYGDQPSTPLPASTTTPYVSGLRMGFGANLEGIPEAVDRYSSPDAGEEEQFDHGQDNRGNGRVGGGGLSPTASLTSLNTGKNWGAGGRFGIGAGANVLEVGANIDRTGVIFRDLKASLGFGGGVTAEVGLLGRVDDPDRFEGAVNVPVGQGNLSLTGGTGLRGGSGGNSHMGLTYGLKF
jgi:hypothetical protein